MLEMQPSMIGMAACRCSTLALSLSCFPAGAICLRLAAHISHTFGPTHGIAPNKPKAKTTAAVK